MSQPSLTRLGAVSSSRVGWLRCSLPLLTAGLAYLYGVTRGEALLQDSDTMWHVAAGRWILAHGAIPTQDPFSHTMRGAPWTAHEWLSEIVLAIAHDSGGWMAVVGITSLALAVTIGLLSRALLRWLEPIHVVLAIVLAMLMTASHLLARPHVLAMPCMVLWVLGLVQAREEDRAPSLWLLPIMALWANLHGGFILGLGLSLALAAEALIAGWQRRRAGAVLRPWLMFVSLATAAAMLTPHGAHAFVFTWQVMVEDSFALQVIDEWRSPDFHRFQPLEAWVLGLLALALYKGLRLPPMRLLLLLGLVHLSLKHVRNVELLGLLAPILLAPAFAVEWRRLRGSAPQFDGADRLMRALSRPAEPAALLLAVLVLGAATVAIARSSPPAPPERITPAAALRAVRAAGVNGPVFNGYGWGGYLIYAGVAPFIDGRADVYRDAFIREYMYAMDLRDPQQLPKLLEQHGIAWTLLAPDRGATALLDHLPGWRRLYADKTAVVHVRTAVAQPAPHDSMLTAQPPKE